MKKAEMVWIAHERYNEDADVNLICFPYAGGSATYFAPLKSKIDPAINVCPILYPGRERNLRNKKIYNTVEEMAVEFVQSCGYLFQKKFALLGHCTGSLIAYEIALVAKKLYGVSPVMFFASSAPAPSYEQFFPKRAYSDEELTKQLLDNQMIDEEFVQNKAYSTYYLPLMRSDLQMHANYEPKEPYVKMETSVKVLYGDSDSLFKNKDAINQWNNFAEHGVTSAVFPGGHFYIDSCREEVGALITNDLCGR